MSRYRSPATFIAILLSTATWAQSTDCRQEGEHPQPVFSAAARQRMEADLEKARITQLSSPQDPDALIWLGRRQAYLGLYHDALETFGKGIKLHPTDARFLRHRGHRWITLRCLDNAVSELTTAAGMVRGRPDEVEPDGMPNERNIPTSTLQSNIWYHLGLAHYLKGDYDKAVKAYRSCLKVSKNDDMFAATANWYHLALRKAGRVKAAGRFLKSVDRSMTLIENEDYLAILRLYIEQTPPDKAMQGLRERRELSSASYGYGLGEYLLSRGDVKGAKDVFSRITADPANWSSFGYIASEKTLASIR